ncbi:MAG TPA: tetratricopeptide repeat protein [Actinomycetota bacterium]|nr:tetratricopeptide repeat protein [Actinomycetota bacterium]
MLLALAVLVLGGAVLAVKLRPDASTASAADRELQGWQQAVADEPKSDVAQTGLGLALLDAGRLSDAQAAFEEALRLNPENWMANFQLGLMMRESQPDRALDLLDLAAKNAEPGDKAVPLIAAGDIMLERGDAEGARDAYRRSIADVSYLFDSHLGLAKALEQLGETQDALEEYRSAARFAPDDPEVQAAIDRLKEQL